MSEANGLVSAPVAGSAAPDAASAVDPAAEFLAKVKAATPWVWVTPLLVAANVAVYVWMVASGVDPMQPAADAIVAHGGGYAPLTASGQYWRLVTQTFVHIGALHLAFNMAVLLQIGLFMERMLGNVGFAFLYLLTGVAASLVSTVFHPDLVTAGASGAVFGVYGGFLGVIARKRRTVPKAALKPLTKGVGVFLVYNLIYSFQPDIDLSAHVGGLVSGLALGLVLAAPLERPALARRVPRQLVVAVASLCALAFATWHLQPVQDVRGTLVSFGQTEQVLLGRFNALVQQAQAGTVADAAIADALDREIIPEWRRMRDDLAEAAPAASGELRVLLPKVVEYASVRLEGFERIAQGTRTQDRSAVEEGQKLIQRSDQLANALQDHAPAKK